MANAVIRPVTAGVPWRLQALIEIRVLADRPCHRLTCQSCPIGVQPDVLLLKVTYPRVTDDDEKIALDCAAIQRDVRSELVRLGGSPGRCRRRRDPRRVARPSWPAAPSWSAAPARRTAWLRAAWPRWCSAGAGRAAGGFAWPRSRCATKRRARSQSRGAAKGRAGPQSRRAAKRWAQPQSRRAAKCRSRP